MASKPAPGSVMSTGRSGNKATDNGRAKQTKAHFRTLNRTALLPILAVAGTVTVAKDAQTWWDGAVLASGVVAAVVAFVCWTSGTLMRVVVPCLAVSAMVWPYGVQVAGSSAAFFGITMVGTLAIPELRSHRGWAAIALAGFVAAVGLSRLFVTQSDPRVTIITYVLIPAGITVVVTGLMFPNKRFYDVVSDLEASRQRDAELAVSRERIRFASDLHDIQGHTLHVVKLKVALAQRLVNSDTRRVEQELSEIYGLISETIAQTKDLAHAQRRLNLSAELENAKNLFEAAGIRVRVVREAESDARVSEQLGQVLRETTTNILRHAQATYVQITLSGQGISIVNDGVREADTPTLRGLATLKHRVAGDGGELTVRIDGDEFLTAVTFGPQAAITNPSRRDHR